jgi:predicted DNA-binding ribbon-helix-helix protein
MHSIGISGRRTTVRLEDEMWASFKDVAEKEGCTLQDLASRIYSQKKSDDNFSSAIRVFLVLYYRDAAREVGRARAGRGRRAFSKICLASETGGTLSQAGPRGKRSTGRGASGADVAKPIDGAQRCLEAGDPDEGSLSA